VDVALDGGAQLVTRPAGFTAYIAVTSPPIGRFMLTDRAAADAGACCIFNTPRVLSVQLAYLFVLYRRSQVVVETTCSAGWIAARFG